MGKSGAGDALYKEYEGKLKTARVMAYIAIVMYGFNWFLGFCALTWASAVILGALLPYLTQHDYYSVMALLLLEALRLSTTTFFGKFVHWRLVHGSADPQRLVYDDATRQNLLGIARILEQAFHLTVFAISILVPIRRLEDLHFLEDLNFLAPTNDPLSAHHDFDGLKTSLRIFYVLVLINGAIAGLAGIFSKNVVPFFIASFSLRKYYEKIVWKGMDEGLLHATDFDFLSWTFQMLADEYRGNTRALTVMKLYGDMMKFLYYHPRLKGFEAAKVALESDDTFEREAAANIVGSWVTLIASEVEKSDGKSSEAKESEKNSASWSANAVKSDGKKNQTTKESDNNSALTEESKESDNNSASSSANAAANIVGSSVMPIASEVEKSDGKNSEAKEAEIKSAYSSANAESDNNSAPSPANAKKVNDKRVLARLLMQTKLLAKLADALDNDESGRAASSSFLMIAESDPEGVLMVRSEGKDKEVADILMDCIHQTLELGRPKNALVYIKVMIPLLSYLIESHELHRLTPAKLARLKEDTWKIVLEYASGLKRLQVVAAYVCDLLWSEEERQDMRTHLLKRTQEKETHILEEEQEYLFKLLDSSELPDEWEGKVKLRSINMEEKALPCLAKPTTALLATLGIQLAVLVVASYCIKRYGHF